MKPRAVTAASTLLFSPYCDWDAQSAEDIGQCLFDRAFRFPTEQSPSFRHVPMSGDSGAFELHPARLLDSAEPATFKAIAQRGKPYPRRCLGSFPMAWIFLE